MITKYSEFIVEQLITMINESEIVYSKKFRNLIKDINSPIAKELSGIETKDFDVANNYFDISDNKDVISFITDRKVKEILGSEPKYAIYIGGPCLTHNLEKNGTIFNLLEYTPNGSKPFDPEEDERGEIIKKAVSPISGKVFVRLKFPGGECVINQDNLKMDINQDVWTKNRQTIRIGRAIRALLNVTKNKFTDAEIEDFVNKYKSAFDRMNDIFGRLELVSGDDIAFWYNYRNYLYGTEKGTLGNSCMCNVDSNYFDIYTKNPKVCSLLILKSDKDSSKIVARALVWNLTSPDITFMDRIYYTEDSHQQLFREYAAHKKWYAKSSNDSSPEAIVITPEGNKKSFDVFTVKIENIHYAKYPYVDTLKYYYKGDSTLSTDEDNGNCLESTDGSGGEECSRCDGSGRIPCYNCDCGQVECDECNGSGEIDCDKCDGAGEIECDECEGSGEIDGNECPDCNGSGEKKCPDCKYGKVRCSDCDGDGEIECDKCEGSGEMVCPDCDGSGNA